MQIDANEITRSLRAFFVRGDVFEIRVLNAVTVTGKNNYESRPHTEAGYFDYDHIDSVPMCLEHIKSASGCYVTPNPVDKSLLARSCNRIQDAKRIPLTKDEHVVCRRWLLIDCDVNKASGISSTEEEHENARGKAEEIEGILSREGFPEPVLLDSGNGYSLMYAIDLPTDDEGTVQRFVHVIADLSDKSVTIDESVFNPSRIWRLPGTMNCKGDSTYERPHRMARIASLPESIEFASKELIYKVCNWTVASDSVSNDFSCSGIIQETAFDIDSWIREYCPELGSPVSYKEGRKWVFPECPFDSDHKSPDACLYQRGNGAIAFKCSHNHCSKYDWHSLRDMKEPGWNMKKLPAFDPAVDISGITGEGKSASYSPDDSCDVYVEDNSPFIKMPEELYNVPGIIRSVYEKTLEYAPSPNRPLALGGAIALMSTIVSRKVVSSTGATPNVYILLLEDSGNGKNFPRSVNKKILLNVGMIENVTDRIASGPGFEDLISNVKTVLWQNDEFQYVLADIGNKNNDNNSNAIGSYMLQYYTDANEPVAKRCLSGKSIEIIYRPHLVLLGTTTPAEFFERLNKNLLRDGFFSRLNVITGEGLREPDLDRSYRLLELDDEFLAPIRMWSDYRPSGSGNLDITHITVKYTVDAEEFYRKLRGKQYERESEFNNEQDKWKSEMWARFVEMVGRYALIYACSISPSPESTVITIDAVKWASAFVEWDLNNRIRMIEKRYYSSEYESNCMHVIGFMTDWHDKMRRNGKPLGMPSGEFNRKMKRFTPKQTQEIISGLSSQKRIVVVMNEGKGGGCKYYLPVAYKEETGKQDKI